MGKCVKQTETGLLPSTLPFACEKVVAALWANGEAFDRPNLEFKVCLLYLNSLGTLSSKSSAFRCGPYGQTDKPWVDCYVALCICDYEKIVQQHS
jgi:hypothetical protein